MFMHSYFYPTTKKRPTDGADTALLLTFSGGVFLGCLLAAPFSDLVGRELALSLLSSARSTVTLVLWLILPLLAAALFSLLGSRRLLLAFPAVMGFPFGYTVFFLLRFLGAEGLRAALLLLGGNAVAFPGVFWFLSRRLQSENESISQDLILAAAACLSLGLAVESILVPFLGELAL